MKEQLLNRRKLLGVMAASSSTLAVAASPLNLTAFLKSSDGESKVRAILKKHFKLENVREKTIGAFYQSLLLAQDHRENQQFFLDHLDKGELEERLEIYVIEEFFVSTNYTMISAGFESELRMLKA